MLDIKKVYVNEILNALTVRDTPEKMMLVEKVIAANDLKEAEIILDVEILEISRTNALKYGWNFTPGGLSVSASVQGTPSSATAASSGGIALSELRNLSKDNIFVTLPGLVVNLIKQDSDAQTLANPRVRVLNNKKATFHVGERIPIQTSVAQTTTTTGYYPTSTFDYKDVGIKLNIEPTVHLNNTVTLNLKLEISTLGDALNFGNGQIQYKFGTRITESVINLRDGETVIIGGLIKDEERKSRLKIPILGDIPILGKLFSSADDGTIKTDILMSITPNIVRGMELPDKDSQTFWSGTEQDYDTKPLFITDGKSTKQSAKSLDKAAMLDSLAKREAAAHPASGETSKLVSAPSMTQGQPLTTETAKPVSAPSATKGQSLTSPSAVIEIRPTEASVSIGQEVRFDLLAGNMTDAYGAIITLTYDPKVVEFKSASEGTLLKKDNQQTSFLFSNNIKGGTVDIYMTRIGDVGGVNGAGSMGTLVFQAKSGGTSELSLKGVKLTNVNHEQIKAELKGAKVVVK
jgi:general secretion pathway protein D